VTGQIPTLATYYRKAIQAYAAQGIPIYGMTLQNEPEFSGAYPSTLITADQERQLAVALKTELTNNSLGATKIWAFDHNFSDGATYASGVLGSGTSHSNAYSSVDGIAFHDYSGDPSAMATVKATYPDKDVLMTERSVWGTAGADRLIQYFRNSATLYEGWVSMLDQNHAPTRWPGVPDPTMLVQSASNPDTFWALPDYYMIAQFSKFVQPGAKRVSSNNGSSSGTTNVAFQNPDGTLVTVVVNQTAASQPVSVRVGTQQFAATLPAKTVGTYVWAGATSGTGTPSRTGQIVGYGGKCVDVAGANANNGTAVQLYTCNGTTAQQWTVGTDGTLRALGKCLDVAAANPANGTKVQIYDCNQTTAQTWTAGTDGTLRSLGKCLDATGPSSADGTKLQIWDCAAGANQRWTLP
jgi:glucosylceramidase